MENQTHDTQDKEKTQHKTWYQDVNHKQEPKNQIQRQTQTGVMTHSRVVVLFPLHSSGIQLIGWRGWQEKREEEEEEEGQEKEEEEEEGM